MCNLSRSLSSPNHFKLSKYIPKVDPIGKRLSLHQKLHSKEEETKQNMWQLTMLELEIQGEKKKTVARHQRF